ncbi:hypothetical protein MHL40_11250 [Pseudomonas luteola]|uniref:hypothetical protein n=1 Tax=Pseudomonas luteola TaxID=47886 RepID=UPI001EF4B099|nr:hypothetical protein [Pseudomonas luteola]MCG7373248.1 hypothetical protein [Pseudomonas luteola]
MNILEENRDIVPVWSPSKLAARSPELLAISKKQSSDALLGTTQEVLAEFLGNKNVGIAIELINVAIIENENDAARIAAEFILEQNQIDIPFDIQCLTRKVAGLDALPKDAPVLSEIARLRKRLKNDLNDPLAWIDLARAYTVAGEKERSIRAMQVGTKLCSGHRWVSRVASRFYLHHGDIDQAYSSLVRNPNFKNDPWLLAAEMAVARLAKKPLKHWNTAKKLSDSKIRAIHLSELNSSIATSELIGGAEKKAKNYFKQSLVDPTENSLAQAKWAERTSSLDFTKQISHTYESGVEAHEAKYWSAYNNKDMFEAFEHAKAWYNEEPYSAKPVNAISYIASLLNDFHSILRYTDAALTANPENNTLKLNNIYSWIGKTDFKNLSAADQKKAEQSMKTLRSIMYGDDRYEAAHAIANIGMLHYRTFDIEKGKTFYDKADELFSKSNSTARLLLLLNHIRESLISEAPWAGELLLQAKKLLELTKSKASPATEFYLDKIHQLSKEEGTWAEKFSAPLLPIEKNQHIEAVASPKIATPNGDFSSRFWLPSDFNAPPIIKTLLSIEKKKDI